MKIALLFLFALAGFVSSQEDSAVHHVTSKADFEAQLEAAGHKLVVVYFYATWCGGCKRIAPKIEEMAKEFKGEVVFLKVNYDELHELAVEYEAHALPNFVYIKNKEEIERLKIGFPLHRTKTSEVKKTVERLK